MYDFDLQRPKDLDAAIAALADEGAQPLSGGQTLLPTMKARLAAPERLVSLMGIDALRQVRRDGDVVRIGGAATHGRIADALADLLPGLADLSARIGDPAVRTRGTIGGSVANNDPAACWPAGLLACDATIVTAGPDGTTEHAADAFFKGMFETALEPGHIVSEVQVPLGQAVRYEKMIQPASRFALTAVCVARRDGTVRVAVTGAGGDGVFRWTAAEDVLTDRFDAAALEDASVPAADALLSDIHGSGAYRADLVAVLTRRAVAALAKD
ncbi:FAD binding domain-containing protein [Jannaschia sp. LMIT008]|uniref:FAD binding domain-containing protein n=1 Tax=Jannaschia maritima TaxID=3032585 RepID=UPI0028125508|nr:FAD binding domain-containing protein [Jannaschia sp. LMIT008]